MLLLLACRGANPLLPECRILLNSADKATAFLRQFAGRRPDPRRGLPRANSLAGRLASRWRIPEETRTRRRPSCSAARALAAQKPPAQATPEPFSARLRAVEVSVTNVEVVVTDSKGNRVAGLTREDFEALQDGSRRRSRTSTAVSGGKVLLDDGKVIGSDSPRRKSEIPVEN